MWSIVATWPFSLECVEKGVGILQAGDSGLDAVEQGINVVESDPEVDCVGRGGFLNADGELPLDGAVMDGDTLKTGAVMCMRNFEHPVSVARAVMERTKHNILVGTYAEDFARSIGIPEADDMITEAARQKYFEETGKTVRSGHDTIGCVALDANGSLFTGTSTSGANLRMPGRVGDTPVIGSGFYVRSGIGGAVATGLGEDLMRTCVSFRAVELMGKGYTAQQAAEEVIRTAHETLLACGLKPDCMALVCLDAAGNYGGAANHRGFTYAAAREGEVPRLYEVTPVIDRELPEGGTPHERQF